jgi:hypothetical protein
MYWCHSNIARGIKRPIFAIWENSENLNEQKIVKVCKSISTVRKFIINTDKSHGISTWSLDHFDAVNVPIEQILKESIGKSILSARMKLGN